MTTRTGSISVNTTDILPIIKKWLYSEHDIFLRELISNASDAITKRETLGRIRNQEIPEGKVSLVIDAAKKTLTITDNGLGMTDEEVEKYICKLAFSGAEEFVQKMKNEGADHKEDIISKFGLGFYSAFMVADKVEVESLSMNEDAKPTKWVSNGDTEYTFHPSEKTEVGTQITLYLNEESKDFLELYKTRSTVTKYCDFMPYPIALEMLEEEKPEETKTEEAKTEEAPVKKEPEILNETTPLWKKDPATLKDEDYINFYRKQFPMDPEPLFWIHLKVDHPFELLGVLYFPKLNPNRPMNESNIKLYAKQVFVSDNVKDIIPEFLNLLKGHIDSPDIPLNVSRSSLQGDPNVKKISNYIIKKVSESLKKLFKKDREKFEKVWEDTSIFVKYGCVSDMKFDEIMRDFIIFKNADGKYMTLSEYKENIPESYKEKMKNNVIYYEQNKSDMALINQLKEESIPCIETDSYMDPHFMQNIEMKKVGDQEFKFVSIESEIENLLSSENVSEDQIKVQDLFKDILGVNKDPKEAEKSHFDVEVKSYKNSHSPAYYKVDEQMKRFQQMTKTMGQTATNMPIKKTLVINPANPLIQNVVKIWEKGDNKELAKKMCQHVKDIAAISSDGLNPEEKDNFVVRTQELVQELSKYAL